MDEGDELPEFVVNKPSIFLDLIYVWDAFAILNQGRNYVSDMNGNRPAPITFMEVCYYAGVYGYMHCFDDLYRFVKVLDNAYLKYCSEA